MTQYRLNKNYFFQVSNKELDQTELVTGEFPIDQFW